MALHPKLTSEWTAADFTRSAYGCRACKGSDRPTGDSRGLKPVGRKRLLDYRVVGVKATEDAHQYRKVRWRLGLAILASAIRTERHKVYAKARAYASSAKVSRRTHIRTHGFAFSIVR